MLRKVVESFKTQEKAKKMRVKLFCSKLFLAQIISRKTLNDHSRQSKTITIFIYKVIVKSGVALVIDTGFARYIFADMYWV